MKPVRSQLRSAGVSRSYGRASRSTCSSNSIATPREHEEARALARATCRGWRTSLAETDLLQRPCCPPALHRHDTPRKTALSAWNASRLWLKVEREKRSRRFRRELRLPLYSKCHLMSGVTATWTRDSSRTASIRNNRLGCHRCRYESAPRTASATNRGKELFVEALASDLVERAEGLVEE